jgi:putative sulfotransferase
VRTTDPTDPIFVVTTGRSGSTLLSTLMRAHPEVCSISEFFSFVTDLGGRLESTFASEPLDGNDFAARVATPGARTSLLRRHGLEMPESLYRTADADSGSTASTVPPMLEITLPHLTGDQASAKRLHDELMAECRGRPSRPVGDHYRALFERLRDISGARVWVERSGMSSHFAGMLRRHFPRARFVVVARDGPQTALSMARHRGFRLVILTTILHRILRVDPFRSDDRTRLRRVPQEFRAFLPESFDRGRFEDYDVDSALAGRFWSGQALACVDAIDGLEPDRLHAIRYETLCSEPRSTLRGLFEFLGVSSPSVAWFDRHAPTIRKPADRVVGLPPPAQDRLRDACGEGTTALGRLKWR